MEFIKKEVDGVVSKEVLLLSNLKLANEEGSDCEKSILNEYFFNKVNQILDIVISSDIKVEELESVSYKKACCEDFRNVLEMIYNILNNDSFKVEDQFGYEITRYCINITKNSDCSYYPARFIAESIVAYVNNRFDKDLESMKYNWIENDIYLRSSLEDLNISEEIKFYINFKTGRDHISSTDLLDVSHSGLKPSSPDSVIVDQIGTIEEC